MSESIITFLICLQSCVTELKISPCRKNFTISYLCIKYTYSFVKKKNLDKHNQNIHAHTIISVGVPINF